MEVGIRILALSIGGVFGVNARYWLGVVMGRWVDPRFPWATFTINASGSFAIGFLTVALARWLPHSHARLLVLTGFLGGYTTFSTYAYESATLWEREDYGLALANLVGSVAAGFAAVWLGIALARPLTIPAAERARDRAGQRSEIPGTAPLRPLDVVAAEDVTPEVEAGPEGGVSGPASVS